ncbi:class I SAM-dependent methyltransferase [Acinetobacter sp. B51(2017)]|uniref:class I SAM-dependent methyltransferase n=1 Tax=Acinetobacter sp. B51(2017) TaxID=2060938 RepID=UPI000F07A569|nr:class I SAM-dependent methyltransferase [Acinetobacter sp. B51(2017)]
MQKQNGYVIDTLYPSFFYKEMTPLWLSTVVKFLGFVAPQAEQNFSYLELACATGSNLLLCAANYPQAKFVGIDFNPLHIAQAKSKAKQLGLSNVEFIHCDFAEFLATQQQQFDFIVNHGTYAWVAAEQQQNILAIVHQFLKQQGIFYLHYMCYPGSAALHSIQKLLHVVAENSIEHHLQIARKLCGDLYQAGAFVNQPKIEAALQSLAQSDAYLEHEFLTDHWQPLYSVDVHQQVYQQAGLNYVGSAHPCENLDSISIPAKMQPLLQQTQAPALKEYLKDLARDAKQRVDIFQKNPCALSPQQHVQHLNELQFKLLASAPLQGLSHFQTPIGQIQAPQALIGQMFAQLQHKHCSFQDFLSLAEFAQQPIFLMETLFLLMQAGYIHPVLDLKTSVQAEQVSQINQYLTQWGIAWQLLPECGTAV